MSKALPLYRHTYYEDFKFTTESCIKLIRKIIYTKNNSVLFVGLK